MSDMPDQQSQPGEYMVQTEPSRLYIAVNFVSIHVEYLWTVYILTTRLIVLVWVAIVIRFSCRADMYSALRAWANCNETSKLQIYYCIFLFSGEKTTLNVNDIPSKHIHDIQLSFCIACRCPFCRRAIQQKMRFFSPGEEDESEAGGSATV